MNRNPAALRFVGCDPGLGCAVIAAEISHPGRGQGWCSGGIRITDNGVLHRTSREVRAGQISSMKPIFVNPRLGRDNTSTGKRNGARTSFLSTPTLVLIDLGMNDGGYKPYEDGPGDAYIAGHD